MKHKLICLAWILVILCLLVIHYILWENERQTQEMEKRRQELSQSYWGFGKWIYQTEIMETYRESLWINIHIIYTIIGILIAAKYVIDDIILKM